MAGKPKIMPKFASLKAYNLNMNHPKNFAHVLKQTVEALSDCSGGEELLRRCRQGEPLPSLPALEEIVALCRAVLFPGYYGRSRLDSVTVKYYVGMEIERLYERLTEQIAAGLCFGCGDTATDCGGCDCRARAAGKAAALVERLPEVRRVLTTDVEAAYLGDPAAQSRGEVVSCYPSIKALTCYRVAHELYELGVPLIPRIITEMAHSETGIDIHPAARIGEHFAIDHGTGVVIGATCIIGHHVKIYQGVTLGAKSFPLDEAGNPVKNIPRHPILHDNVIVYSNATVLGRVTVGNGAVVGANVWLTRDVAAGERVSKE